MSTVKLSCNSVFEAEINIYKLFAANLLSKFDAKRLLNKCTKIFNNATEELEAVTEELNSIIMGE